MALMVNKNPRGSVLSWTGASPMASSAGSMKSGVLAKDTDNPGSPPFSHWLVKGKAGSMKSGGCSNCWALLLLVSLSFPRTRSFPFPDTSVILSFSLAEA